MISWGKAPLEIEALTQLQDFLFSAEVTFLVAEMTSVKVLIFNVRMVREVAMITLVHLSIKRQLPKSRAHLLFCHMGDFPMDFFGCSRSSMTLEC